MKNVPFRFLWILAFLLFSSFQPAHGIYLSILDIFPGKPNEEWRVELKIFTDDLEDALNHFAGKRISLVNPASQVEANDFVQAYIDNKLRLSFNGKEVNMKFLRYENIQEATMVHYSCNQNAPLRKLTINNSILTEVFDTQKNIVRITYKEEARILPFDKTKVYGELKWE